MNPNPDDAFSGLTQAAIASHELFISFTSVGFTEHQALYLTGQAVRAAMGNSTEGN